MIKFPNAKTKSLHNEVLKLVSFRPQNDIMETPDFLLFCLYCLWLLVSKTEKLHYALATCSTDQTTQIVKSVKLTWETWFGEDTPSWLKQFSLESVSQGYSEAVSPQNIYSWDWHHLPTYTCITYVCWLRVKLQVHAIWTWYRACSMSCT